MFRQMALAAVAALFVSGGASSKPAPSLGPWQVDNRHSDAQLLADATTDFGKTKTEVTLGFGRISGQVNLNNDEPAKSTFDFSIYPATSMSPSIDEDGKFLSHWLANLSNHTLVCFHSKEVTRRPDGRLQAKGSLVLTRVDRNLEATPNEAYAGPVYGPPILHRVTREATFLFDLPAPGKGDQDAGVVSSGSTSLYREDFPQLVQSVLTTYWPPLVQDKNCQAPSSVGEDYKGSQCTGTFLEATGLPDAPHAGNAEDIGANSNFNAVVGNHLTILVHLRLTQKTAAASAVGGE